MSYDSMTMELGPGVAPGLPHYKRGGRLLPQASVNGAHDGNRTRQGLLGRQLSRHWNIVRMTWSSRRESNSGRRVTNAVLSHSATRADW